MCKLGANKDVLLMKQKLFSGRIEIKIDDCIAPLVQMLNDYGIETVACCCGHGKTAKSHIRISSKNILLTKLGDDFSVHLQFPCREKEEIKEEIDAKAKEMIRDSRLGREDY